MAKVVIFNLLYLAGSSPLHMSFAATDGFDNDYGPWLDLRTNGPAVLDSDITVFAHLRNVDMGSGPYSFTFADDGFPGHFSATTVDSTHVNYTLKYSSTEYEERNCTMTVRAFNNFEEPLALGSVYYRITKELTGRLYSWQNGTRPEEEGDVSVVSTRIPTILEAAIHDPAGYLKNASTSFYWFINDSFYGSTNENNISHEFVRPGISSVEVMVLAKIESQESAEESPEEEKLLTSMEKGGMLLSSARSAATSRFSKTGVFRSTIDSRIPMTRVNSSGNTWLKHGDMLELDFDCDGSGPWTYCWFMEDPSYNATGNETCVSSQTMERSCSFEIMWYFRDSGEFALIVVIDDKLNHTVKQIGINVYNNPGRLPLSLILIPITCSIVAVMVVIAGAFVCMTFKRNLTGLETADFDFSFRDDRLEYKTFWERLRDSVLNAFTNAANDTVSHVSSVSSRSVQGPPVGIHYGSIT